MRLSEFMSLIDTEQYLYIHYPPDMTFDAPAWNEVVQDFISLYKDYVVLHIWGDETVNGASLIIDIAPPVRAHG